MTIHWTMKNPTDYALSAVIEDRWFATYSPHRMLLHKNLAPPDEVQHLASLTGLRTNQNNSAREITEKTPLYVATVRGAEIGRFAALYKNESVEGDRCLLVYNQDNAYLVVRHKETNQQIVTPYQIIGAKGKRSATPTIRMYLDAALIADVLPELGEDNVKLGVVYRNQNAVAVFASPTDRKRAYIAPMGDKYLDFNISRP